MSYDLERPNGLLGHMMAFEGITDAVTIVHGPTGCKQYPSDLSEKAFRTRNGTNIARNLYNPDQRFYMYQPRLPCTYLDGETFISGAADRLSELYDIVCGKEPSLIGILNAPGASLIGEDLSKVCSDIPTVRVESPGFSGSLGEGFQDCAIKILEEVATEHDGPKHGVCIIGLGIWQYRWADSVRELRRMLALCDIDVLCTPFAGSSAEEIGCVSSSELNIVVFEEYGGRIAGYLKDRFGTDYVCGCPFGFDAVEKWITDICGRLGKDPSRALEDVQQWRRRSAARISQLDSAFVQISGRTFSVDCHAGLARSVTEFAYSYLGLIPVAVSSDDPDTERRISETFRDRGIPVSSDVWDTPSDMVLSSGTVISSMISRNIVREGVDIAEPSRMHVSITDEPLLGTMGTVITLQRILDIIARITR